MKQEQNTERRHGNAACFIYNEDNRVKKQTSSIFGQDNVIKIDDMKPEVISFPFSESTQTDDKPTETQSKSRSHRAAFTMVSAIFHMKFMADKTRALKLKEMAVPLEKDLRRLSLQLDDVSDDVSNDDAWDYLRNCRYLRGVDEDKELTCEEIFE